MGMDKANLICVLAASVVVQLLVQVQTQSNVDQSGRWQ